MLYVCHACVYVCVSPVKQMPDHISHSHVKAKDGFSWG